MDFKILKDIEKENNNKEHTAFTLRIHRIVSWGYKAETTDDRDIKFISYWICFNAIYGSKLTKLDSEFNGMKDFFNKISMLDKTNQIIPTLMEVSASIKSLLDNKYVYNQFWTYYDKKDIQSEDDFKKTIDKIHTATYHSLINSANLPDVLELLFSLIYLVRNQVFHGCSTYNGSINCTQVISCCNILEKLLPVITDIVINNEEVGWDDPSYPVVNQ